ncbi:hypothetical protein K3N28_14300 [Glycomyces sp. TRM65418]|uniref:hypothetical protein n=1 Tax=Glycomyces sp. TRM65418 TaxID=2867006 RepID=UPI001CE6BCC7|nr:hypothetical protein [Glycomyces sp. TRM65418]MCC3764236.1 hypothetical protein [Glycomyces sp. TRM65418]QZD53919.1 hypothetical protein K3N28_14235 [Glycomyces sp. TRM65418]
MLNHPQEVRRRRLRFSVLSCLMLVWLVTLMWLWLQAGMACVYPDPPPGGCPDDEARALLRFELWFGPVFLAGPIAILAAQAWLSPPGQRYKPVWYLLAVTLFCAAPGLLVDAASSGFADVDRADAATGAERLTTELKLAVGAVAAIAAPAGLAFITARRGHRTYAKVWATLSIIVAALGALTIITTQA